MSAFILYFPDSSNSALPVSIDFGCPDSLHTSYELFTALKSSFGLSVSYWEPVSCVSFSPRYVLLVDENGLYSDSYGLNPCASLFYGRSIVGPAFVLVRNGEELDFLCSEDVRKIRSFLSTSLRVSDFKFPVVKSGSLYLPEN